MKTNKILTFSIIGIILSIILFSLFVTIVAGTTIYLLDSVQGFWIPTLISLSIIFGVSFVINIILYSFIILNKNDLVKNTENEFSFWIASFIFWILPALAWFIFILIYNKEKNINAI